MRIGQQALQDYPNCLRYPVHEWPRTATLPGSWAFNWPRSKFRMKISIWLPNAVSYLKTTTQSHNLILEGEKAHADLDEMGKALANRVLIATEPNLQEESPITSRTMPKP